MRWFCMFLFTPATLFAGEWTDLAKRVTASRLPALMESNHVPGVSMAVVEDLQITWLSVYGKADVKAEAPVTTNTLFEAASMSKPLFAYAVMKLVENKRLDLDRPLVDYLGKPYLPDAPKHKQITARMVLNHTSGFPNWRKGGWKSGKPFPLKFDPGTQYGYSGEGFLFLQRVVEKITKEGISPYMRREFMLPTGMPTSSYEWDEKHGAKVGAGHDAKGEVKKAGKRFDEANAAYSLLTTPSEYARFLIEMMNPNRGGHSISADSVTDMLTETSRSKSGDRIYGLGWALSDTSIGRAVSHGGSNSSGFRCYSRFYPDSRNGIVIMSNAAGGKRLYQALLTEIEGK